MGEEIQCFFDRLKQYHLRGDLPPALTASEEGLDGVVRDIEVFFDGPVLASMLREPHEFRKEIKSVVKYGYKGRSMGGQNGICALRKVDSVMDDKLAAYEVSSDGEALLEQYGLNDPAHVKIVVHRPNGMRVIGFYDQTVGRMLFTHHVAYKK